MKQTSPITVKDLAKICGVSIGTVDRAINNRKGINAETRDRILKAAEEYGFVKNQNALTLSSGKSRNIGVIIFNLKSEYFTSLLTAVESEARARGYATVIMMSNYDADTEIECARRMLSMNVAGIIVFSVLSEASFYTDLVKNGTPIVAVGNRIISKGTEKIPYAGIDDFCAMKASCEYVISKGYRRLVYIAPLLEKAEKQNIHAQTARMKGFLEAVTDAGDIHYRIISNYEAYEEYFAKLEEEPDGTALICPSDMYTLRCLTACGVTNQKKSRFGIMGFDRFPMFDALLPRLSGVAYSTQDIGRCATQLIFEPAKGDTIIPFEIVKGETI